MHIFIHFDDFRQPTRSFLFSSHQPCSEKLFSFRRPNCVDMHSILCVCVGLYVHIPEQCRSTSWAAITIKVDCEDYSLNACAREIISTNIFYSYPVINIFHHFCTFRCSKIPPPLRSYQWVGLGGCVCACGWGAQLLNNFHFDINSALAFDYPPLNDE